MTQRFEKQEISNYHDPDRIVAVADMEFVKCKIYGSGFGFRHATDFLAAFEREKCSHRRLPDSQVLDRPSVT